MSKKTIATLIGLIGTILIIIFSLGLGSSGGPINEKPTSQVQTDTPQIVSSQPEKDGTVGPNQPVQITFNISLESTGEFKNKWDPKKEVDLKLSDDRKTITITPRGGWDLGQGYTLTIGADTKFDGKKTLGHDELLNFKSIDYQGV